VVGLGRGDPGVHVGHLELDPGRASHRGAEDEQVASATSARHQPQDRHVARLHDGQDRDLTERLAGSGEDELDDGAAEPADRRPLPEPRERPLEPAEDGIAARDVALRPEREREQHEHQRGDEQRRQQTLERGHDPRTVRPGVC
jgi:hypothetical protein